MAQSSCWSSCSTLSTPLFQASHTICLRKSRRMPEITLCCRKPTPWSYDKKESALSSPAQQQPAAIRTRRGIPRLCWRDRNDPIKRHRILISGSGCSVHPPQDGAEGLG